MRRLSPANVSAGLPAPSAAAALLGTSGAVAMLILLVSTQPMLCLLLLTDIAATVLGCHVRDLCRAYRRILAPDIRRVQALHQSQGYRGTNHARVPPDGCVLCVLHGIFRPHLLLHWSVSSDHPPRPNHF
jgi:hypothetical protein